MNESETEARHLPCGCVEFSNGEIDLCMEHLPTDYEPDPDHWNPAEGGNRPDDDYW